MRIVGIVAALALVATLGACGGEQKAACRHNDEIDQPLRDGATGVARAFFEKLLKGDAAAYDNLTAELQKKVARAEFTKVMTTITATGPYSDLRLDHAFQPTPANGETKVACGELADLKAVSVSAAPGLTQIHTLLSARSRNNDWALNAWMVEQDGVWRVRSFNAFLSSVAGMAAPGLLALADAQEKKGNTFNAHLLYVAAKTTAERGPDLTFGIRQEIEAAIAKHKAPPELTAQPPFEWTLGGTAFTLDQVSFVGIDKQFGLMLLHRDPAWDGEDTGKAERLNKRLIDAFVKAHPEYKETFAFLVARILAPGKDSGWGTVFDAAKGYDTGEPSVVKKPK